MTHDRFIFLAQAITNQIRAKKKAEFTDTTSTIDYNHAWIPDELSDIFAPAIQDVEFTGRINMEDYTYIDLIAREGVDQIIFIYENGLPLQLKWDPDALQQRLIVVYDTSDDSHFEEESVIGVVASEAVEVRCPAGSVECIFPGYGKLLIKAERLRAVTPQEYIAFHEAWSAYVADQLSEINEINEPLRLDKVGYVQR